MKLWNELTEEEQKAIIDLVKAILEILDESVVKPLVELFDDLSWFFMAAEDDL